MTDSLSNAVEQDEAEPPSCALKCLESSLRAIFEPRFKVSANEHDNSVSICHRTIDSKGFYEMFRVYFYNHTKNGKKWGFEVGDNSRYISRMQHPKCAIYVKAVLKEIGFSSFHNSLLDYSEKRFHEELAARNENI